MAATKQSIISRWWSSSTPVNGFYSHRRPAAFVAASAIRPRPAHRLLKARRAVVPSIAAGGFESSPAISELVVPFREETEAKEKISTATLLWRAAKLPIYSVGVVPVTVGSAAAYLHTGTFSDDRYLGLLATVVFLIAALNLSNDVFDFDTGADKSKPESVVNITGSRQMTLFAAILSLILGAAGAVWAAVEAGDIRLVPLIALPILMGYVYQCPPFRLAYKGVGEPLAFLSFGPFPTAAAYLSQIGGGSTASAALLRPVSGTVLSASTLCGLTAAMILFCSHFHQIDGDRVVGKMSPLVRMGTKAASKVLKIGVISLYVLLISFTLFGALPLSCALLCSLTIPVGKLVVDFVEKNHNDKIRIFMAKYYVVRLHSLFGVALSAGLALARKG